jgi:hypothetical protein
MFTETHPPDCFKSAWIKTKIRSSLVCVCFDKRLRVGSSYVPRAMLFVIKPLSFVTESNNSILLVIFFIKKKKTDNFKLKNNHVDEWIRIFRVVDVL